MKVVKSKKFTFENNTYDVTAVSTDEGFKVFAELNGKRVNPYVYGASFEIEADCNVQNNESAVDHLMDLAQSDIEQKIWGQYLSAVKQENT